ncbi:hypothetical protein [Desulforhabdus sp. TSK]|uniref:hypothetical protein n=1 Tax=Desulforhabdus sp. TSK TaxID=2925014 RepID=UPI001FC860A9|nr:hypothetical protein [Desulforhabdus sp. TSK]
MHDFAEAGGQRVFLTRRAFRDWMNLFLILNHKTHDFQDIEIDLGDLWLEAG